MSKHIKHISTWIVYPVVMVISLFAFHFLKGLEIGLSTSSYIAAIIGGLGLVTSFELVLPYKREYLPNIDDIKADVIFVIAIQVFLPFLLSIISVMWVETIVTNNSLNYTGYWPQDYSAWMQVGLIMLISDFFRYWLSRVAHRWLPLWRQNGIHNSAQKLDWLNIGRFRSMDKSLQFFFDALPFIMLGVSKEVLALYFVIYSINGFFQCSNVDVKLGWLNYVISGPELDQWQYPAIAKDSKTNYGNNLVIWDLLFGIYFSPKDRIGADLFSINRYYPINLFKLIVVPFIKAIDKSK